MAPSIVAHLKLVLEALKSNQGHEYWQSYIEYISNLESLEENLVPEVLHQIWVIIHDLFECFVSQKNKGQLNSIVTYYVILIYINPIIKKWFPNITRYWPIVMSTYPQDIHPCLKIIVNHALSFVPTSCMSSMFLGNSLEKNRSQVAKEFAMTICHDLIQTDTVGKAWEIIQSNIDFTNNCFLIKLFFKIRLITGIDLIPIYKDWDGSLRSLIVILNTLNLKSKNLYHLSFVKINPFRELNRDIKYNNSILFQTIENDIGVLWLDTYDRLCPCFFNLRNIIKAEEQNGIMMITFKPNDSIATSSRKSKSSNTNLDNILNSFSLFFDEKLISSMNRVLLRFKLHDNLLLETLIAYLLNLKESRSSVVLEVDNESSKTLSKLSKRISLKNARFKGSKEEVNTDNIYTNSISDNSTVFSSYQASIPVTRKERMIEIKNSLKTKAINALLYNTNECLLKIFSSDPIIHTQVPPAQQIYDSLVYKSLSPLPSQMLISHTPIPSKTRNEKEYDIKFALIESSPLTAKTLSSPKTSENVRQRSKKTYAHASKRRKSLRDSFFSNAKASLKAERDSQIYLEEERINVNHINAVQNFVRSTEEECRGNLSGVKLDHGNSNTSFVNALNQCSVSSSIDASTKSRNLHTQVEPPSLERCTRSQKCRKDESYQYETDCIESQPKNLGETKLKRGRPKGKPKKAKNIPQEISDKEQKDLKNITKRVVQNMLPARFNNSSQTEPSQLMIKRRRKDNMVIETQVGAYEDIQVASTPRKCNQERDISESFLKSNISDLTKDSEKSTTEYSLIQNNQTNDTTIALNDFKLDPQLYEKLEMSFSQYTNCVGKQLIEKIKQFEESIEMKHKEIEANLLQEYELLSNQIKHSFKLLARNHEKNIVELQKYYNDKILQNVYE